AWAWILGANPYYCRPDPTHLPGVPGARAGFDERVLVSPGVLLRFHPNVRAGLSGIPELRHRSTPSSRGGALLWRGGLWLSASLGGRFWPPRPARRAVGRGRNLWRAHDRRGAD